VSRRSVGSIVGLMGARMGILKVFTEGNVKRYQLKNGYEESLELALENV